MPRRFLLIALSFLFSLILYIDRSAISTVKDKLGGDASEGGLGYTDFQVGLVFSAFAFAYALGQTPGGLLADKFGPRKVLSAVAILWSVFTALTGVVRGIVPMVAVRALFGLGEAGAYPTMSRAFYSWLPPKERGLTHGLNFSGGRIGSAISFPLCVWLITIMPWQAMFWVLGGLGLLLTVVWWVWFRDDPADHKGVSEAELAHIRAGDDQAGTQSSDAEAAAVTNGDIFSARNSWLLMAQYVCSNFTFFFVLSWSFSYLKSNYEISASQAAVYNMYALFAGAVGNWVAGATIDALYRNGKWVLSRRLPAIFGFALASFGMAMAVNVDSVGAAVFFISLAVFGADMTLSPSWSTCNDVGRKRSGVLSGSMNMAGNFGSAVMAIMFPLLLAWGTNQGFKEPAMPFFYTAASLNFVAIVIWLFIQPNKPVQPSAGAGVAA